MPRPVCGGSEGDRALAGVSVLDSDQLPPQVKWLPLESLLLQDMWGSLPCSACPSMSSAHRSVWKEHTSH